MLPEYTLVGGEKVLRNTLPFAARTDADDPREADLLVVDGPDYPLDYLLELADAREEARGDRRAELNLPAAPPPERRCRAICHDRNHHGTKLPTTHRCVKHAMFGKDVCNLHRYLEDQAPAAPDRGGDVPRDAN